MGDRDDIERELLAMAHERDKWKSLAGELRDTIKQLRELFQPQSPTVEMINEVLAKAREAGL